jgi:hydrogenase-4 component E
MTMADPQTSIPEALNTLCAGLVLISAFAMVATRQMQGVVRYFIIQSLLLSASCFLLAYSRGSSHLWILGGLTVGAKVIVIPWILKRLLPEYFYERREIAQAVNIPASLLISLLLAIGAEVLTGPIAAANIDPVVRINLPIGLAGVLIGAYSLIARREAIPQLIGILAMENGAFLAGIAVASELPLIAELGVAGGVVLIVVVVGLLTRNIRQKLGTSEAANLSELKEEAIPWR